MIPTFDYRRTLAEIEGEVLAAVRRVLQSGQLLLGPETEAFEAEFAAYVGRRHCVAVGSGTTAIHLALWGLGVGDVDGSDDEVITVSNTCAPTIAALRMCGAKPVFAAVGDDDLLIDPAAVEAAVGRRTRCLLPVHLWGGAVAIERLVAIAERHGLALVEDCAQAHGTRIEGRLAGSFGAAGCFSFYPTKNIGAYGDAGAVVTDDGDLAERLRALRMYGYRGAPVATLEGTNARISELQAAVLRIKLRHYPRWLERRREIAAYYDAHLDHPDLTRPARRRDAEHSFHQYVVRTPERERLIAALDAAGVGYGIHYPVPCHKMPAYERFATGPLPVSERAAEQILSLPLHEGLRDDEVERVAAVVNSF